VPKNNKQNLKNKNIVNKITSINLTKSLGDKIMFCLFIVMIGFGTYNLAMDSFAQESPKDDYGDVWEQLQDVLIKNVLGQVGPIVAGAVGMGFQFARTKGLAISAEAEEYFVNSAKTFVTSQSRWIYEQMRDNKGAWEELDKKNGGQAHVGGTPKSLGRAARDRVVNDLMTELKSDEFTRVTRNMLKDNVVSLVERTVTENNKELSEKSKGLIESLAPLAVDAMLLPLQSKEEARQKSTEIIDSALKSIKKNLDYEEIPFDKDLAEVMIKSELFKRIGSIQ